MQLEFLQLGFLRLVYRQQDFRPTVWQRQACRQQGFLRLVIRLPDCHLRGQRQPDFLQLDFRQPGFLQQDYHPSLCSMTPELKARMLHQLLQSMMRAQMVLHPPVM